VVAVGRTKRAKTASISKRSGRHLHHIGKKGAEDGPTNGETFFSLIRKEEGSERKEKKSK